MGTALGLGAIGHQGGACRRRASLAATHRPPRLRIRDAPPRGGARSQRGRSGPARAGRASPADGHCEAVVVVGPQGGVRRRSAGRAKTHRPPRLRIDDAPPRAHARRDRSARRSAPTRVRLGGMAISVRFMALSDAHYFLTQVSSLPRTLSARERKNRFMTAVIFLSWVGLEAAVVDELKRFRNAGRGGEPP